MNKLFIVLLIALFPFVSNAQNVGLNIGDKAPEVCPTCNHPKAYFEIEAQNY